MLSENQIKNVATLAKLNVDADIVHIEKELNSFLALIDALQDIDTTDVDPMAHPFDYAQRLREDDACEENKRKILQQNAPLIEKGHYLVPKVL